MQTDGIPKPQQPIMMIVSLIGFFALAALITFNIYLFKQVAFLESQLNSYVITAAKSHAGLNFQRRDYRFYASTSQSEFSSEQTTNTSVTIFPVSSKWDDLYIAKYNEAMKSAMNKSATNMFAVPHKR